MTTFLNALSFLLLLYFYHWSVFALYLPNDYGELEIIPVTMAFSSLLNSKFFYSLSITSISERIHGTLNVGKKIINYTIW
jgi:hypothetical protein